MECNSVLQIRPVSVQGKRITYISFLMSYYTCPRSLFIADVSSIDPLTYSPARRAWGMTLVHMLLSC